jgi:pimeloyl-ACP methyl ester carboxylesterase
METRRGRRSPVVRGCGSIPVVIAQWFESGAREAVRLPDGRSHDIFVRIAGPDDGRWLTMLHGFPTCSYDFAPLVEPLTAAGHRQLLFDFLGFGDSDKPKAPYRYADQVAITLALWDRHGVERTGVVAHDYGVSVAQELLAAHGERLTRVAFMNGGLYPHLHRAIAIQRALKAPVVGAFVARLLNERAFARNMRSILSEAHQPSDDQLHQLWLSVTRRDGHRNYHRLIKYIDERRQNADRWAAALERTDRPLQFVWGDADPISGETHAGRSPPPPAGRTGRVARRHRPLPAARGPGLGRRQPARLSLAGEARLGRARRWLLSTASEFSPPWLQTPESD